MKCKSGFSDIKKTLLTDLVEKSALSDKNGPKTVPDFGSNKGQKKSLICVPFFGLTTVNEVEVYHYIHFVGLS